MSYAKFHSPPAWSMGSGKKGSDWRGGSYASPGPGSYSYSSYDKQRQPTWRIGTAARDSEYKADVPGPGSYSSPSKIKEGPKYHFGMRSHTELRNTNPGPGSYNVDRTGVIGTERRPPSYSMRPKTASMDGRGNSPGPGAYNQSSRILNQTSPNVRIGTSNRSDLYQGDKATPGPGAYGLRPSSAAGPRYGFGTARRDGFGGTKATPGPGSYSFRGTFEAAGPGTSTMPGATMTSRRPMSAGAMGNPGPGAYSAKDYDKQRQPTVRIGTATRDGMANRRDAPGPGAYNPALSTKSRAPTHVMGTSTRRPLSAAGDTPGPGSYMAKGGTRDAPRYTMTGRKEYKPDRFAPGPGAYNPDVSQAKERPATVGIGTGKRHGLYDGQDGPGPGYYNLKGTLTGPRWGFGTDARGRSHKDADPGPGTYNIPTSIADVPRYVFGGSPAKIHL